MKKRNTLLLILNTLLLSTASVYVINKLIHLKAISKERLHSDNYGYYDWKFGKIFYSIHGSGSPLLLIHDLSSEGSSYEWRKTITSLSKDHTVYTLDLIGCGKSDKPNITYTNYLYVQLINDFIKNIIKHKTHVIATGISTSAAVMACYIEPDLFLKLTLVNPPSSKQLKKYPRKINNFSKKILQVPIWGTFIYNIYSSKIQIRKRLKKKYFYNAKNYNSHTVEAFSEASHLSGYSSKFLMASLKSYYLNVNITQALRTVNHDIQIIIGSNNGKLKEIKNYYASNNPSIKFTIIRDTNYLPQLERPEMFVNSIFF